MFNSNTWKHLTANKWLIELFISDRNEWNHLTVYKKWAQACLKMLSTKCRNHIFNIYV